jgi:hypothetical protein
MSRIDAPLFGLVDIGSIVRYFLEFCAQENIKNTKKVRFRFSDVEPSFDIVIS